jgi:hypothetical protein
MSKKGTSRRMLPNHSNLTPEEVRKFPRSKINEMIEAGDTASSKTLRIELKESVDGANNIVEGNSGLGKKERTMPVSRSQSGTLPPHGRARTGISADRREEE